MTRYIFLAAVPAAYAVLLAYAVALDRVRVYSEQFWDWDTAPSLRREATP
jgi:hypothetical protein